MECIRYFCQNSFNKQLKITKQSFETLPLWMFGIKVWSVLDNFASVKQVIKRP